MELCTSVPSDIHMYIMLGCINVYSFISPTVQNELLYVNVLMYIVFMSWNCVQVL